MEERRNEKERKRRKPPLKIWRKWSWMSRESRNWLSQTTLSPLTQWVVWQILTPYLQGGILWCGSLEKSLAWCSSERGWIGQVRADIRDEHPQSRKCPPSGCSEYNNAAIASADSPTHNTAVSTHHTFCQLVHLEKKASGSRDWQHSSLHQTLGTRRQICKGRSGSLHPDWGYNTAIKRLTTEEEVQCTTACMPGLVYYTSCQSASAGGMELEFAQRLTAHVIRGD